MKYVMKREFTNKHSFDEIDKSIRELLAEQGFGILTEIDVKATMKKKLGIEKRPYKILGACSPPRANKVLDEMPDAGIFLPCNVLVYQNEDMSTTVSAIHAMEMFALIDNETIAPIAKEVNDIFVDVLNKLVAKFP